MECRDNVLSLRYLAINIRLLPVKASYFFMLGGVASLLPFLAVYMRQVGLSTSETAIIYGLMPFIGALVRPLFGAIADAWNKHKAVLTTCCVLTAIFHGLLLAVPHHTYSDGSSLPSNGNDSKTSEDYVSDLYMDMTCGPDGSSAMLCPEEILAGRGCNRTVDHVDIIENWEDHWHFKDCSLRCKFKKPTNGTKLCLHQDGETRCYRDKKKFGSIAKISSKIHKHLFHHLLKNKLFMGPFFEIEQLSPVHSHQYSNGEVCYKYTMERFLYNETEYEDVANNGTVITCDADSQLTCQLDCDVMPDVTLQGYTCPGVTPTKQNTTITPHHHSTATPHFGRVFWMFFLLYFMAQLWFAPLFSLNDGIVYDYLGEERYIWGKQRLWGTVGFIVFAFISGLAMDIFSNDRTGAGKKNYAPAFILFVFNNIVAGMVVFAYKISPEVRVSQMMKHVTDLFKKPEVVSIFVVVFIFGMYTGVIETFLYWHLLELGAPQVLLGLCMVVNCIPEILILFGASTILLRLGHVNAIYVVFMAYFVRFGAYYFINNPWYVLLVEPLHGVTFGLMYAAVSGYASEVTPTGLHGTVQGIIGALHFGFGKGVGALTAGWVLSWAELHHMFLGFSITALICLMAYFLCNMVGMRIARFRRGHRLPSRDTRDKHMDDLSVGACAPEDAEDDGNGRISQLLDDFSVGFEKDKQALVFKDDPAI